MHYEYQLIQYIYIYIYIYINVSIYVSISVYIICDCWVNVICILFLKTSHRNYVFTCLTQY